MSDNFTSKLVYENIDGRKIRIARSFVYHVGYKGSGEIIRVPVGFVCDGMSYPLRWAIAAVIVLGIIAGKYPNVYTVGAVALVIAGVLLGLDLTPQGKGARAGVVHDRLYWLNGRPNEETGKTYSRLESDEIFREALEVSGVNPVSREFRFWMLRAFGWAAWNDHAKRIAKENA